MPKWFYGTRWELIEAPITNCYRCTFCRILVPHQTYVYRKSDMAFACTLLIYKRLLFILVCCCSIFFISISSSSIKRHLNTFVRESKLILLSLCCLILISRISIFCLLFCCFNIVVFSVRIFWNLVLRQGCFFHVVLLNWYQIDA